LLGIDESHFTRLSDGVPWRESEDEILRTMLFRLRDFRLEEMEAWAHDQFPPPAELADPGAVRGEVFRLRGRALSVEEIRLSEQLSQRYNFDSYFRCRLRLEDGRTTIIFARAVASQWRRDAPIDERAGALAFFLKLQGGDGDQSEPVFVARRIAWYADTPLGKLGMDVGLLDDLRPAELPDGREAARRLRDMRLTSRNRECFYQMLAAAGRAEPGQLLGEAEEPLRESGKESYSVEPLFNDPGSQHGRLVVLSGTAREIVMIRVADEDIQARFGIDHYYQISIFTDDSQGNPLVFCVRELPEGMPTGKGPGFGEYVTAAGFFFNSWAYRSQGAAEGSGPGSQWQLAPLLIGRDVIWQKHQPQSGSSMAGAIAATLFALVLAVIWFLLWRNSRRDKRFHDKTLRRHLVGEPSEPLGQLNVDDSEERAE